MCTTYDTLIVKKNTENVNRDVSDTFVKISGFKCYKKKKEVSSDTLVKGGETPSYI